MISLIHIKKDLILVGRVSLKFYSNKNKPKINRHIKKLGFRYIFINFTRYLYIAHVKLFEMALDPNSLTLTKYLMSTLMNSPDRDGSELVSLLVSIQNIVKTISAAVRRAGIVDILGGNKGGGGALNVQVK